VTSAGSAGLSLWLMGAGVSLGGTVWLIFRAFGVSRLWGWLCLIFWPFQLGFLALNFRLAWAPFLVQTVGSLIAFAGQMLFAVAEPEMVERLASAGGRRDEDRERYAEPVVEQAYIPVPDAPPRDDDPGRLVLLSPGDATATVDGAAVPVPVEVALPPGFHDIVITDSTGTSATLRARIARRTSTQICWNFAWANYCNVPQLEVASQRW
jgi:hypothetical protein